MLYLSELIYCKLAPCTDFILCLDTEIEQNIKAKQQQLSKIAKWTKKNIIYMNNLSYDIKMEHRFLGDVFVFVLQKQFITLCVSILYLLN